MIPTGAVTEVVAPDDFDTLVNPERDPVIVSVIFFPRSADTGVYVDAVAPAIATFAAYHLNANDTGPGNQIPVFAVNGDPTTGDPEIVGDGVCVNVPATTLVVAPDDFDTDVYPDSDPVTVRVIFLPTSPTTGVYVDAVAPAIATSAANHLNANVTDPGPHVPVDADNTDPTAGVPTIVGDGVCVNVAKSKCTPPAADAATGDDTTTPPTTRAKTETNDTVRRRSPRRTRSSAPSGFGVDRLSNAFERAPVRATIERFTLLFPLKRATDISVNVLTFTAPRKPVKTPQLVASALTFARTRWRETCESMQSVAHGAKCSWRCDTKRGGLAGASKNPVL